jgi:saccharopine dehydrogenase (NAD+, L-lysine-forming)
MNIKMSTHIWLRAESKPLEERTTLTPRCARQLVDAGFQVTVEQSDQSAFASDEYKAHGCAIVAAHSWKTDAPVEAIILGLKELEAIDEPLKHRHIQFAHIYKQQRGWQRAMNRFVAGGGTLYDLEFLEDDDGRRVAAFGYWAGYAGAALALLAWARQQLGEVPVLGRVTSRPNQHVLLEEVMSAIASTGKTPTAMVIGALGRSGKGAVELCRAAGADVLEWDLAETKRGGPFAEVLEVNILLNCVFVAKKIPPFVTLELLDSAERRLSLICDVSCDPYGDYNSLPIYEACTTFDDPVLRLIDGKQPLDLIAIDHLPSLLPIESSEEFCSQLMPHLLQLDDMDRGVWKRSREVFNQKSTLVRQES